jgi:hypothetical protein
LDRLFGECNEDVRVRREFFLMSGSREQEAIYSTDRCVGFVNCTPDHRR